MNHESKLLQKIQANSKTIYILCGTGGVGKTTTSAAIAISLAQKGKRVLVVTIDPAKRLATSLGIDSLHNEPKNLTALLKTEWQSKFPELPFTGEFFALMPETEKTFERFIKLIAWNKTSVASKILSTTIYKVFAQDFSGMNEYLAMEKLYELHISKDFDVIVLDTPPSSNTLEFLKAPNKLFEFFDDRFVKWFVEPGNKLLAFGLRKALDVLGRLTGKNFISELIEFVRALFELRTRFIENLQSVQTLLKSEEVAFFVVSSPERIANREAQDFLNHLEDENYPFHGIFLNRSLCKSLNAQTEKDLIGDLNHASFSAWTESEKASLKEIIAPLESRIHNELVGIAAVADSKHDFQLIAEHDHDVYSLSALIYVAKELS